MIGIADARDLMNRFTVAQRGKAIRKFRRDANLTQDEFGAMVGLTGAMISAFERGISDVSVESFARIQSALNEIISDSKTAERLATLKKKAPSKMFALVPSVPSTIGAALPVKPETHLDPIATWGMKWARRCAQYEELYRVAC